MPTVGQIIERNARLCPQRLALVCEERRVTHREYAARVRKLASALYARGVRRGDRVSILAMNCSEYFEVYGAAEWAGYTVSTINWRLAAPEIEWIVADAKPRVLVFETQYAGVARRCAGASRASLAASASARSPRGPSRTRPCSRRATTPGRRSAPAQTIALCIIYTSGTTGRPKGVVHSNRAYAKLAEILSSELQLGGDGKLLAIAPIFHIGARSLSSGQHWRGGTVVLHRGFDARR